MVMQTPPAPVPPVAQAAIPTPEVIRGYLLDVAGLAFVAAAIYVGVFHGAANPEFGAFTALAGAYLGIKGQA